MMSIGSPRRALVLTLIAIAVASAASAQAPDRGTGSLTIPGPIRVIEADTLEVFVNGSRFGVAVIGIKAPPGNTACGRQAIAIARELVAGGIFLDEELTLPSFDGRYRRLYRVTTADGRPLAAELAREGLAAAAPSDERSIEFPGVVAAQADARAASRGCLWSPDPR